LVIWSVTCIQGWFGCSGLASVLASTPVRSATGKTLVVASTHGNKQIEVEIEGQPVFLGLNAYIYPVK